MYLFTRKVLLGLGFFIVLNICLFAQSNAVVDTNMWQTNGAVNSIVRLGNAVYLGGEFTYVGPHTGSWVGIDATSGVVQGTTLKINGTVNASVSDGSGGWFIGGSFTSVAGVTRNYLAHIFSNNTLDLNWNPGASNPVLALALSGNILYVGGQFIQIGGQIRNRLASLNATTGQVTSWIANANGVVRTIAVSGNKVYVGGDFTSIRSVTRNRLAAINATTGIPTSWNPDVDDVVRTIALKADLVYVGGDFNNIGVETRYYIASIDTVNGWATSWNPEADNRVRAFAFDGDILYVGGDFFVLGGQLRRALAAIDINTAEANSFGPDVEGTVSAIAISGTTIYFGGEFLKVNNQVRNRLASIDINTGVPTTWNPNPENTVNTISINSNVVYAGGDFRFVGGEYRNRLAAIDTTSGRPTSWDPGANNTVNTLVATGNTIYVGGQFGFIGGENRNRLAAISATTGLVSSWNPNPNNIVNSIVVNGNLIYVGGQFTSIGGQTRNRLAAISATTGLATSWNPNVNNTVNTIAFSGNVVYVGGQFTSAGGQTRNRLAGLDATTGLATSWNPNVTDFTVLTPAVVNIIAVEGSTLYIGGLFSSVGGLTRDGAASFDITTGLTTAWNPSFNDGGGRNITGLAFRNNLVYLGGNFTRIGGQNRARLAAVDATTGLATSWNPSSNDIFYTFTLGNNFLYVGGRFSTIGNKTINNFTAISTAVSCTTPPTPTITAGGPTTFCSGGSVTLTAPTGFSYLWSNNATTQSINVTTGGSYTVRTIAGTCTSSVSLATVVTVNNNPSTPTITAGGPTTFCSGGSVTLTAPTGFSYLWSNNETTQSINVTTGGSYTVRTIDNGCTSSVSLATVVTVNNNPSTPTITAGGPTTFCSGGSVTLSAPAGFSYLWSNNATTQSINVTTGGSYTVRTIDNGCTSSVSLATVVTVNNNPSTPTITAGGPTTFCSGGSVTLTAPAGFSYLWSNNETTQSINVTTGGSYTVRTIDNGCTSSVSAATVVTVNTCGSTWVGGNSTAWNNASNWSNNQVPGATTDITVPAGTANTLNLNGSFMCRNITLDAGATINLGANALMVKGNANLSGTITGNGGIISLNGTTAQNLTGSNANVYRLEVANPQGCTFTGTINITDGLYLKQGVINNNNGTFTLKSSSTGTAFLDNFSSGFTGSLTAGIQVERYSTGAYRHVGAPLAGQTINALNVSCLLVRTFDEPSNSWMPIGSNCELQEFDNLGGISFNAGTASSNPTTVTFIGFPVSGGISFPLVRTTSVAGGPQTGWNSLYNPYASPIDWNVIKNFGTNGSITNRAVWIWNSNINNWATLTGLGIAANGASNIIASGQGILVRRLTNGFTGNNFTMDNTCRLGLNTTQFLRSANPTNQETIRFTLSNESQKDETVIHLTNLSSQELDENDAERPVSFSKSIELSTLTNTGEKLMVNSLPAEGLREIPISISTPKSGSYQLMLTENLSNLNVQILDLKTGRLTPAENGITITTKQGEEISSRYKLIFNNKKTDASTSFTAWAINTTEIQIASLNENLNNLEVFNAVGQKLDFTSQLKGEGQATIKLSNPSSGILFIRLGNTTERVVISR